VKSLPYTKKFHSIAVTHPVRYNSVGVCGVFLPGYLQKVCDFFQSYEINLNNQRKTARKIRLGQKYMVR
jgi:hypothetical protein